MSPSSRKNKASLDLLQMVNTTQSKCVAARRLQCGCEIPPYASLFSLFWGCKRRVITVRWRMLVQNGRLDGHERRRHWEVIEFELNDSTKVQLSHTDSSLISGTLTWPASTEKYLSLCFSAKTNISLTLWSFLRGCVFPFPFSTTVLRCCVARRKNCKWVLVCQLELVPLELLPGEGVALVPGEVQHLRAGLFADPDEQHSGISFFLGQRKTFN